MIECFYQCFLGHCSFMYFVFNLTIQSHSKHCPKLYSLSGQFLQMFSLSSLTFSKTNSLFIAPKIISFKLFANLFFQLSSCPSPTHFLLLFVLVPLTVLYCSTLTTFSFLQLPCNYCHSPLFRSLTLHYCPL